MTDNTNKLFESLKYAILSFVNDLQSERKVNHSAYKLMCSLLEELCLVLRGEDNVSKRLLAEVYFVSNIMENEAMHVQGEKHVLIEYSDSIRFYFELMLLGKLPDERKPGVPRII